MPLQVDAPAVVAYAQYRNAVDQGRAYPQVGQPVGVGILESVAEQVVQDTLQSRAGEVQARQGREVQRKAGIRPGRPVGQLTCL